MPKHVQLPDGTIGEFPDSMQDSEIEGVLQKQFPHPSAPVNQSPDDMAANAAGAAPGWKPRGPKQPPSPDMTGDFQHPSAGQFGANAIGHAVDTVAGAAQPLLHSVKQWQSMPGTVGAMQQMGDQANEDWRTAKTDPARLASTAIGDLAGTAAIAGAAHGASKAVAPVARGVGDWAKARGVDTINKTIGTLKSDVKRGNNPGRGYLEADLGPSSSMDSIAAKAEAAKGATGRSIQDIYSSSTKRIPSQDVFGAVSGPAVDASKVVTGEGGSGPNAAQPYLDYVNSFDSAQVGGPKDYSPGDVWRTKRNVAQNTSWSDPTALGMKQVRQQGVGRLSGVLQDAVPESAPLLEQYGDLTKLADRSSERAANPASMSLSKMFGHGAKTLVGGGIGELIGGTPGAMVGGAAANMLDSVPAKTTAATGLWKGGKLLNSAAPVLDQFGKPISKAAMILAAKGNRR